MGRPGRSPGQRVVRRQVERILASSDFDASPRSKDFLRFIVEEALTGHGEEVTQSAIATRVFGRREDFDATVDPIVRIQAGRLRRSLERYYLLSGKLDSVLIELRRGTYVPAFSILDETAPQGRPEPPPAAAPPRPAADEDWPSVAIRPFAPARPGAEHEAAAGRVTDELVLELGRHRGCRTLLQRELDQLEPARRESVRFALGGRLREEAGELRVSAQLLDRATGEQVWGDEYDNTPRPGRWSGSLDDIARVVAARVGAEDGVLVQHLAAERRRTRPATVTPYGAKLLSYEFFLTRDPERFAPALAALRQAVKAEPDAAVLWTRLGRVCLVNYAFDVTPLATPIEEAISCAQNGVRLDPANRRGRCVLAASLIVKGELQAAREEVEQAYRQSPDSLVYLEIIGLFLSLLGDERGPGIIRTARERNPHALTSALMGLWLDHLRRGEVERAYQCALEFRESMFFWRGVMRASCLGLLGRVEEARSEANEVLLRKPDFKSRGRTLIGYQIKFPDVMDRVVDGLGRAGLRLD